MSPHCHCPLVQVSASSALTLVTRPATPTSSSHAHPAVILGLQGSFKLTHSVQIPGSSVNWNYDYGSDTGSAPMTPITVSQYHSVGVTRNVSLLLSSVAGGMSGHGECGV